MMETIRNTQNNSGKTRTMYDNIKLPKNLRQIGQAGNEKKIFIEDYVMTYIKQMTMKNYGTYQVAVLLGKTEKIDEVDHIFVNGAVEVVDVIFEDDKVFTNEAWTKIYEDIKKYFDEVEIVGWYITRPGLMLEVNDRITKIHLDNFAGSNKVLLMYDSVEREEEFYLFDETKLERQGGYYIYYERNDAMQTYMIDHKDKPSIEADYVDHTSINIRSVLERKSNEKVQKKRNLSVMYAVATVLALFVLVAMATMISGIQQNKSKDTSGDPYVLTSNDPLSKPTDSTTVNVNKGDVNSIKGENINGDKTKETPTVAPTAEPTKKPEVVVDGTDPIETKSPDGTASSTTEIPKYHIIQKGETLGSISMKYYSTKSYIKKIQELNKLENSDKIIEGQKLLLPSK